MNSSLPSNADKVAFRTSKSVNNTDRNFSQFSLTWNGINENIFYSILNCKLYIM